MTEALYHPERGYYARVGAGRDYRTSPQTSPAFGHLVGRMLSRMWHALEQPHPFIALELGAGDGALSAQTAAYLAAREPDCAAALRYITVDRFGVADVVADATALPLGRLTGCVLSNELFDALPVHRLVNRGEQWVVEREGRLALEAGPLSNPELAPHLPTRPGQVVDFAPAAEVIIAEIDRALERGYVLTIDYGGTRGELRAPHRMDGTLLAYRGGRVTTDLLERPGEQDLTAHVDFDVLRRPGLRTVLFETQAAFLRRLGLEDWLARLDSAQLTPADLFNARLSAMALIAPGGLGKLRVLLQAKRAPDPV